MGKCCPDASEEVHLNLARLGLNCAVLDHRPSRRTHLACSTERRIGRPRHPRCDCDRWRLPGSNWHRLQGLCHQPHPRQCSAAVRSQTDVAAGRSHESSRGDAQVHLRPSIRQHGGQRRTADRPSLPIPPITRVEGRLSPSRPSSGPTTRCRAPHGDAPKPSRAQPSAWSSRTGGRS